MKQIFLIISLVSSMLLACSQTEKTTQAMNNTDSLIFEYHYAEVKGLKMYYETYKAADHADKDIPLLLIHGGGSTIQSTFEKVIPLFAKNRLVIAVEMQAHGRTSDRDTDLTFEQDADDIAALLNTLKINKADIFGFSNGGTTTLQIAIRHPEIVNKIVLGSALARRSGVPEWFWGFMENASLENMPVQLQEAYLKVAPDPKGLQIMHDRDAKRMVNFKDIPDEQLKSIEVPTLIIIGDKDVITPEHALELHQIIKNSELAIIPGGHGEYIGEVTTLKPGFKEHELIVPLIEKFLNKTE